MWGWNGGEKACICIELRWGNLLGDIQFVDKEGEGILVFI